MQEVRKFSRLEEATFTIEKVDMVRLLQTAAKIPGGFEMSKSSIDDDWPLVVTVALKSPDSTPSGEVKS